MKVAGFAIGGLGVAGLAASGVFFYLRQDAIGQLDAACGPDGQSCPANMEATYNKGRLYSAISTAALIGGGAALAMGGTLIIVSTSKKPASPTVGFVPAAPGANVGGSLVGRF